jgi:tRNA (guanine26-N2/guanine27-N2)-dimethyltransferase
VTLVDFNRMSLLVARRNVKLNGLGRRCTVTHSETNRFLCSRFERGEKFDGVDVDPFGSPAPYLQDALTACADGATLSFTATDAAVLCGVYPSVSLRRYGASSIRNEFVHETGLRILMGFAARAGGVNDIGVEPVLAHSTLHYLRVYLRVRRGATEADRAIQDLGYVTQCNTCLERWTSKLASGRCDSCGKKVRSSGPLWTGKVADSSLVSRSASFSSERGWKEAGSILASLAGVDEFPPFSYSLERACSLKKVSSTSVEKVMGELHSKGFAAARQPFELDGIKTDATHKEFVRAVVAASRLLR